MAEGGFHATLRGKCPRCGEGRLFSNWLGIRPACSACGLDFARFSQGDGPAVFVILIAGFLIVGFALWVEVNFEPPLWVHGVLWTPITLVVTLGLLRPIKAWLIARQFETGAAAARFGD